MSNYFFFKMSDLEGELERRTVTYTSWIQSATNMETRSWHPVTYNYASANPDQIKRIKVNALDLFICRLLTN